jgi:glucosyl-3-phosphoglycerate synthase
MQHIIQELAEMNFVKRIYISLAQSLETFERAREIIQPLENRGVLLWNDAPAVQSVLEKINQAVPLGDRGKGSAVWTALGYALGKSEVSVLAFHDADIVTYDRGFLLRLLYPVVNLRYQFAKGFYVRYSDRLHGRVARLFPVRQSLAGYNRQKRFPGIYGRLPVSALRRVCYLCEYCL